MTRPLPLLVLLFATSSAACSFGMRGVSSTWTPHHEPSCDLNSAAPGLDTAVTLAGIGLIAAGAAETKSCSDSEPFCELGNIGPSMAITTGVLLAATYGIAAARGWGKKAECRKAHREHRAFIRRGPNTGPPGSIRAQYPSSSKRHHSPECKQWRERLFRERNSEERRRIAQAMPARCH